MGNLLVDFHSPRKNIQAANRSLGRSSHFSVIQVIAGRTIILDKSVNGNGVLLCAL